MEGEQPVDEHAEMLEVYERDKELSQANTASINAVNASIAENNRAVAKFNLARTTVRLRLSGCAVALTMFVIASGIWALVRFG